MTKKSSNKTDEQIEIIKKAYDKTVDDYRNGIEDEDQFPIEFKNSERYKHFKKTLESYSYSNPELGYKAYLSPQKDMKFLDVGCAANLVLNKMHKWSSIYYGIDISSKLIQVNQNFVNNNNIKIGGLHIAEVAEMPFENDFFDICAVIGVLEYYDLGYIKKALKEAHRVLKPNGKMFVDMPNFQHPDCKTMIEIENYLGRTRKNVPTNKEFEEELEKLFSIDRIDDSPFMTGYLVRANK